LLVLVIDRGKQIGFPVLEIYWFWIVGQERRPGEWGFNAGRNNYQEEHKEEQELAHITSSWIADRKTFCPHRKETMIQEP